MPTKQEFEDLVDKCEWNWTTQNGMYGYEVRGKGDYASASIFLPCAGRGDGSSLDYAGSDGYYWSSVLEEDIWDARYLGFSNSDGYNTNHRYRTEGMPVRPVRVSTK